MVFGLEDGAPEQLLYRVTSALLLPSGGFVVVNAGTNELKFFGDDGQYRRTIGRQGSGPGEFAWPRWADSLDDGTIVVWDGPNFRIHLFGGDGELRETTRLEQSVPVSMREYPELPATPHVVGLFGDGSLLVQAAYPTALTTSMPDGTHRLRRGLLLYSAKGTPVRELGVFDADEYSVFRSSSMLRPFGHRFFVATYRDKVYVGTGKPYTIQVVDTSGARVRVLSRQHEPRAITVGEQERFRDRFLARVPDRSRDEARDELRALAFPQEFPAYDALMVDAEGNLWVREHDWPRDGKEQLWGVFDGSGAWLGRVATPAGLEVKDVGRDLVVGVVEDEMGAERVQVHQLNKAQRVR